jgi:hypothetical protein
VCYICKKVIHEVWEVPLVCEENRFGEVVGSKKLKTPAAKSKEGLVVGKERRLGQ